MVTLTRLQSTSICRGCAPNTCRMTAPSGWPDAQSRKLEEMIGQSVFIYPGSGRPMRPTEQETNKAHAWIAKHLLSADIADLPFSFGYGEQSSSAFLGAWSRRYETRALDEDRTEHTVVFSDPATGLELRCVATEYRDFPAVEWLLYMKNGGSANTPVLADIQALDTVPVTRSCAAWRFIHAPLLTRGFGFARGFHPADPRPSIPRRCSVCNRAGGVRPANTCLTSTWRLGQAGVVVAIGWTGEWAFRTARDGNRVRLQAGMAHTHFNAVSRRGSPITAHPAGLLGGVSVCAATTCCAV